MPLIPIPGVDQTVAEPLHEAIVRDREDREARAQIARHFRISLLTLGKSEHRRTRITEEERQVRRAAGRRAAGKPARSRAQIARTLAATATRVARRRARVAELTGGAE